MIGKYYRKDYASDEAFLQKQFELNDYCLNNNCCLGEGNDDNGYYLEVTAGIPLLDEVKARKKQELTDARDAVEYHNITTDIGVFEFDTLSQTRLTNAMNSMGDMQTREWTTADHTIVTMYKTDFQEIFSTAAVRSDENFAKLKRLKTQVNNATTVEEVQAIHW